MFVQARSLKLEHEVEKNKILSEALQTLATEHHELEQSLVKGSSPRSVRSEDEFYDALSGAYVLILCLIYLLHTCHTFKCFWIPCII